MKTVQMFVGLQALVTVFLIALFWALQTRLKRHEFFRWWTWAWLCFAVFLTGGIVALEMGREPSSGKSAVLFASTVIGFLQAPLLVFGARSLHAPPGPRWRTVALAFAVIAGTLSFASSAGFSHDPLLAYALRTVPRQAAVGLVYLYCALVFLRMRKRRPYAAAAAVTGFSCLLGGLVQLMYAADGLGRMLAASFNLPSATSSATMNPTWFHLDIAWECGIALGMILLLLEDYQLTNSELRSSEEKFSKAFRSSPDMIAISELDDGREIEVNDSFLRLAGYSRDQVIGRTAQDLKMWTDSAERPRFIAALRENGSLRDVEVRFRTRQGKIRTGLMSAEIIDLGGKRCMLSVTRDITERKLLEDQLRQAQKMEAVGQLAGGVAHDFNNLLMVIGGYSDLLLERLEAGHAQRKYATQIRSAADRAAALTRQLLAFSRQQVLQPRVLDLNNLLMEIGKMLPRVIREDIELVLAPAEGLGRVKADPNQLEQVILNLAVNARDAMPRGGKLTIETANVELDVAYSYRHARMAPGQYVMLAVSDTGIGMDHETQARIFEPFFTTKEHGKGTGLGLATVYGIVKQSGGYIWVYSEPQRGATFKIYLPRVEEELSETHDAAQPAASPRAKETVLLVEDEDSVRELTREFLEASGYRVLLAAGPQEAARVVDTHRGAIDVMITDVVMPGTNGPDLARQLAAMRPEMRVLFVSGYADEAIVRHGILERGCAFVEKPYTRAMLTSKLREVMDKSVPS